MTDPRPRFYAALALFGAWVVGLAVMAFTTSEKPRPVAAPPAAAAPAPPDAPG